MRHEKEGRGELGNRLYCNLFVETVVDLLSFASRRLKIADSNQVYLQRKELFVTLLGNDYTWFDTGIYKSLLQASSFVETKEQCQELKIACLEGIALSKGFITPAQFETLAGSQHSSYDCDVQTIMVSPKSEHPA